MQQIIVLESEFFVQNLWWIVFLGVLALLAVAYLIDNFLSKRRSEKKAALKIASKDDYLAVLGGSDNVIDHELINSRIIIHLNDYKKINKEGLKDLGVTGFIEKSDKLTLVIKDGAKKVYDAIFGGASI